MYNQSCNGSLAGPIVVMVVAVSVITSAGFTACAGSTAYAGFTACVGSTAYAGFTACVGSTACAVAARKK